MSESKGDPRFYLFCEVMFNDRAAAEAMLAKDSSILEARDGVGETALHYLAIENELEAVEWLFERGADINTRDDFQSTPLIAAAQLKHEKLCRFLLDHGADLFAMDHIDRTALSITVDSEPVNRTLLHLFLDHKGEADINLLFGDLDADRLLLDKGPRVAEFWRNLGLRRRF